MKLVLCIFEQLSSLKNNFHKSVFVLAKLNILSKTTESFSVVILDHFHLDILVFPIIFVSKCDDLKFDDKFEVPVMYSTAIPGSCLRYT
jgi:hypothetical protein